MGELQRLLAASPRGSLTLKTSLKTKPSLKIGAKEKAGHAVSARLAQNLKSGVEVGGSY